MNTKLHRRPILLIESAVSSTIVRNQSVRWTLLPTSNDVTRHVVQGQTSSAAEITLQEMGSASVRTVANVLMVRVCQDTDAIARRGGAAIIVIARQVKRIPLLTHH